MNSTFIIAAAVAVVSTLLAITRSNAVHALLYLIVSFFSVAVAFFILGASFVATLEVIVYAGAIMVLFVFVIMLLSLGAGAAGQERRWTSPRVSIGPGLLSFALLVELLYVSLYGVSHPGEIKVVAPRAVSLSLFGTYIVGVELASMLLLAGLVGAFYLGRRIEHEDHSLE
jgi:NADH-quinone oxidoreductase subunit J